MWAQRTPAQGTIYTYGQMLIRELHLCPAPNRGFVLGVRVILLRIEGGRDPCLVLQVTRSSPGGQWDDAPEADHS